MQIVNSYLALNTLRQVGYKSSATAIAELLDNSIEAKANDVFIVTLSKLEKQRARATYRVQEIAVLDNGEGMPPAILESCLSLGWGTRLDSRKGLGRFGFGLKGASLSQARRITVYSWQNGKCFSTYMDLDEIRDKDLSELNPVNECKIPKHLSDEFPEITNSAQGTIVHWSKLDGIDFAKPKTLHDRLDAELCRIYRHFLDDDDTYGRRRNVVLYDFDLDKNSIEASTVLKPNDPLYLLEPSNAPQSDGEATNKAFEKPYIINVDYGPGKSAKVEIRLSIAKPETQAMGGNSLLGRHYGKNTGISFVRAGREIDFGTFGFTNPSDPRSRWWGAEVRFDPQLDELFGVTNNKQQIRGFQRLDPRVDSELIETLAQTAEDPENAGHYKAKLMLELNHNLDQKIKDMMAIIVKRKENTKRGEKAAVDAVVDAANEDVGEDDSETSSEEIARTKSDDEKLSERISLLEETRHDLDKEQLIQLARETLDYKVDLSKGDWPGNTFLELQLIANAAVGVVNTRSDFHQKFWQHLEDANDKLGISALEILVMAYVRTEDEFRRSHDPRFFEEFRDRWGYWVNKLLKNVGE